jgi:hypothetical protein
VVDHELDVALAVEVVVVEVGQDLARRELEEPVPLLADRLVLVAVDVPARISLRSSLGKISRRGSPVDVTRGSSQSAKNGDTGPPVSKTTSSLSA